MSTSIETSGGAPGLSSEEYARRKAFLDALVHLTKSEHVEIVRILKKHSINYNENQNGIFFNVANLAQAVYDDLENFLHFTQKNRLSLSDRDCLMSTLKKEMNEQTT